MSQPVPADIDIARAAEMLPIAQIGARLGIPEEALEPYGKTKAKVSLDFYRQATARTPGRLVLVTAVTPSPAEGFVRHAASPETRNPSATKEYGGRR